MSIAIKTNAPATSKVAVNVENDVSLAALTTRIRTEMLDMVKTETKGERDTFALSRDLYEFAQLQADKFTTWKAAWETVKTEFMPTAPKTGKLASEADKLRFPAFKNAEAKFRNACAVATVMVIMKPNEMPYGVKSNLVNLPAKLSGTEFAQATSITKAGKICYKYLNPKAKASGDELTKAINSLNAELNDYDGEFVATQFQAMRNLLATVRVVLARDPETVAATEKGKASQAA